MTHRLPQLASEPTQTRSCCRLGMTANEIVPKTFDQHLLLSWMSRTFANQSRTKWCGWRSSNCLGPRFQWLISSKKMASIETSVPSLQLSRQKEICRIGMHQEPRSLSVWGLDLARFSHIRPSLLTHWQRTFLSGTVLTPASFLGYGTKFQHLTITATLLQSRFTRLGKKI